MSLSLVTTSSKQLSLIISLFSYTNTP